MRPVSDTHSNAQIILNSRRKNCCYRIRSWVCILSRLYPSAPYFKYMHKKRLHRLKIISTPRLPENCPYNIWNWALTPPFDILATSITSHFVSLRYVNRAVESTSYYQLSYYFYYLTAQWIALVSPGSYRWDLVSVPAQAIWYCGGKSGFGTGFFSKHLGFPHQYYLRQRWVYSFIHHRRYIIVGNDSIVNNTDWSTQKFSAEWRHDSKRKWERVWKIVAVV
jgi:hypothetical protein